MQNILSACYQTTHLFPSSAHLLFLTWFTCLFKALMCKISPWRRLHKQHKEIWHYCPDLNTIFIFLHLPHCIQLLLVPVGSLSSQMRASFTVRRLRTYWFSAFPLHAALNWSPWFGPPISSGPGEVFVIDLTEHMLVAFIFLFDFRSLFPQCLPVFFKILFPSMLKIQQRNYNLISLPGIYLGSNKEPVHYV